MVVEAVGEGVSGGGGPEAAREVVAEVGRPDVLAELVEELAAGTADAAVCARGSFRHVLGFDKLVLVDAGSRRSLRVHVWHGTAGSGMREDVHNHRSALASCVVRGRLGMELYEVAPGGSPGHGGPDAGGRDARGQDAVGQDAGGPARERSGSGGPYAGGREDDGGLAVFAYRETHAHRHGDWRLVPRGPARLRLVHGARYAAGASYALPARTLHRAWCDTAEPTVTLYLEGGGGRREFTDVFSAAPVRPAAVRKGALTVEEYLAALASLSRVLRGDTDSVGAGPAGADLPGAGSLPGVGG